MLGYGGTAAEIIKALKVEKSIIAVTELEPVPIRTAMSLIRCGPNRCRMCKTQYCSGVILPCFTGWDVKRQQRQICQSASAIFSVSSCPLLSITSPVLQIKYTIKVELDEEKPPQEELVEDMIAIVTSFSARIYGKRGGRVAKKLVQLIEQEVAAGEDHS